MILLAISIVFAASVIYDWCSVRYHTAREERRAIDAANWGALLILIVGVNIGAFIAVTPWLALPEAAGAWLGTYLAVSRR